MRKASPRPHPLFLLSLLFLALPPPASAQKKAAEVIDNSFEESLGFKFDNNFNRIPRFLYRKNGGRDPDGDYPRVIKSYLDLANNRPDYMRPSEAPVEGTRNWMKATHGKCLCEVSRTLKL